MSTGSNESVKLSAGQANGLPGQAASFLMGLAAGGFEPVAMRYFRLAPDGTIVYLDDAAIAAIEATESTRRKASARKSNWQSPSFSEAFAHVELQYRRPGDAVLRVHRHLAWDLGNPGLTAAPELLAHLRAKGKVTVLTKGGSYMLWRADFSMIRTYMLDHAAWMLSDSTGVPPAYASAAGMQQTTYGTFSGPFLLRAETRHARDFRTLWRSQPHRPMPYRFGYFDSARHPHLLVTRPGGSLADRP